MVAQARLAPHVCLRTLASTMRVRTETVLRYHRLRKISRNRKFIRTQI